ncbi:zinc finger CCHC domain-containing protein 8 [Trichonephila clavipes]|nr:zinc finger CCHC domain-containing protein 8 [Trichonephila clavipes]
MKEGLIALSYECPQCNDQHDVTWSAMERFLRNRTSHAKGMLRPQIIVQQMHCFNCLGDHHLKDCPEKIDRLKVAANRKDLLVENSSNETRQALGLKDNQLPPYLYRMRVIGYPPGWLDYALLETSGLSLYDEEGKAVSSNESSSSSDSGRTNDDNDSFKQLSPESSMLKTPESQSINSCNSTPNQSLGTSLSRSPGTPILEQGNRFQKLPELDKFAQGITEHLPFENLPDAVGTFEKMRGSRVPKKIFVQIEVLSLDIYDPISLFNLGNVSKPEILSKLNIEPGDYTVQTMESPD